MLTFFFSRDSIGLLFVLKDLLSIFLNKMCRNVFLHCSSGIILIVHSPSIILSVKVRKGPDPRILNWRRVLNGGEGGEG